MKNTFFFIAFIIYSTLIFFMPNNILLIFFCCYKYIFNVNNKSEVEKGYNKFN